MDPSQPWMDSTARAWFIASVLKDVIFYVGVGIVVLAAYLYRRRVQRVTEAVRARGARSVLLCGTCSAGLAASDVGILAALAVASGWTCYPARCALCRAREVMQGPARAAEAEIQDA